jgi:hypothetical protein
MRSALAVPVIDQFRDAIEAKYDKPKYLKDIPFHPVFYSSLRTKLHLLKVRKSRWTPLNFSACYIDIMVVRFITLGFQQAKFVLCGLFQKLVIFSDFERQISNCKTDISRKISTGILYGRRRACLLCSLASREIQCLPFRVHQ